MDHDKSIMASNDTRSEGSSSTNTSTSNNTKSGQSSNTMNRDNNHPKSGESNSSTKSGNSNRARSEENSSSTRARTAIAPGVEKAVAAGAVLAGKEESLVLVFIYYNHNVSTYKLRMA